ncbi:tRNA lysidine(34) synthetase TilS [Lacipirellula parvula]|nr:tRNA lysidine(34) synthetase TilS [Lacipirellula parvula]
MPPLPPTTDLPARLLAAWPATAWCDIHVLVALSGGPDSVALLCALLAAKQQVGGAGKLFAGHVDHSLRGDQSTADAEWLAFECRRLGVPLFIEKANVGEVAEVRGDGMEEAARTTRYAILTRMAETLGARFVALGHHRDDQLETILFRLLRGSGLRGLAGMPASRPLSPSVVAIRPLLGIGRSEITDYLAAIGQASREDETNQDAEVAARNAVRHELLPPIRERFGKNAEGAILRAAEQAAAAQAFIDEQAAALLAACQLTDERSASGLVIGIELQTKPLAVAPPLLVSEALRQAWRSAAWPEQSMTYSWWRQLAQFAQSPEGAPPLNLPGDIRASRSAPGVLSLRCETLS